MANTGMEILLHSKGVALSKTQVTLGLDLTHGNNDFAGLRIQASHGAKVVFGASLESVVSVMIRQNSPLSCAHE
jgi:hypothetical protein